MNDKVSGEFPPAIVARVKASRERIRSEILAWLRENLPAAEKAPRVAWIVVLDSVAQ